MGHIMFRDGDLRVPKEKQNLQKLLSLYHPLRNRLTDALGEDQKDTLRTQIPLQRLGTPEDIAQLVGFLASDAGAYITGETIHVNGGMYMS